MATRHRHRPRPATIRHDKQTDLNTVVGSLFPPQPQQDDEDDDRPAGHVPGEGNQVEMPDTDRDFLRRLFRRTDY